ncbi:MAG: aminomethyltransferase family protein [Pseudomonadota bacterium]
MSLESVHLAAGATLGERNGVRIPLHFGEPQQEHAASRKNILMVDYSHFGLVEIKGDDAYDFLNRVIGGDLSVIRNEQALYTVLLDEQGKIDTDLYVLCDDERFVLLCEWHRGSSLAASLQALAGGQDVEIAALNDSLSTVLFEGPYSWELMAELYGFDVLGLPFLEFMPVDDGLLLRAGKHGEFSYKVLTSKENAEDLWARAEAAGAKFDMKKGGIAFQSLSRLENPCWDPSLVGEFSTCPIELQLQWAVRYDKDEFIGREALLARLEEGAKVRSVGFQVKGDGATLNIGDSVFSGQTPIGKVITLGYSDGVQGYIGQALLDSAYAYAGIDCYEVATGEARVAIATSAIPFLQNFSFMVNPAEHSYVDPSRPKSLVEQLKAKAEA